MAPARSVLAAALLGCSAAVLRSVAFASPGPARPAAAAVGASGSGSATRPGESTGSAGAALAVLGVASCALALAGASRRAEKLSMKYTTATILPSLAWLKASVKSSDLAPGETRTECLGGLDVCIGKSGSGKLFAIGDKAPPTGITFSVGAEVEGDKIVEPQYGCTFDVFSGMPEGEWCPTPPVLGGLIGAFMGGPQAIAVFNVRESFFGGSIEVEVDTNSKRAYEADYWKGVLDAQGKNDGTFY